MNNGFDHTLPQGGEVRVRRCFDDDNDAQIVEFTIETFEPYWAVASLCLTPDDAIKIATSLLHEATTPISDDALVGHYSAAFCERPKVGHHA